MGPHLGPFMGRFTDLYRGPSLGSYVGPYMDLYVGPYIGSYMAPKSQTLTPLMRNPTPLILRPCGRAADPGAPRGAPGPVGKCPGRPGDHFAPGFGPRSRVWTRFVAKHIFTQICAFFSRIRPVHFPTPGTAQLGLSR